MKTVVLSVLLTAVVLSNGGCALMAPDDRDFYGRGWVKPTDLDTPTPHRAFTDPSRPPPTASASARPIAADPDPQWLTPETRPQ